MNNNTYKSDVEAKKEYKKRLISEGIYDSVEITSKPADITAEKNGQKYYFEIKMTQKNDTYFGAATFTEWYTAYKYPKYYKFVIARKIKDGEFEFTEISPENFEQYCTIPPMKVYFNYPIVTKSKKRKKVKTTLKLTENNFNKLNNLYEQLKTIKS